MLQTISLDTNIFIYALDHPGTLGIKAQRLLDDIKTGDIRVFLSVLVLEEFFVKVYKEKKENQSSTILDFLTIGGLASIVEINSQVAMSAAKIRAEYPSIRTPDALHLACAIEAGAEVFITADKRLPNKIGKLKIQSLA